VSLQSLSSTNFHLTPTRETIIKEWGKYWTMRRYFLFLFLIGRKTSCNLEQIMHIHEFPRSLISSPVLWLRPFHSTLPFPCMNWCFYQEKPSPDMMSLHISPSSHRLDWRKQDRFPLNRDKTFRVVKQFILWFDLESEVGEIDPIIYYLLFNFLNGTHDKLISISFSILMLCSCRKEENSWHPPECLLESRDLFFLLQSKSELHQH